MFFASRRHRRASQVNQQVVDAEAQRVPGSSSEVVDHSGKSASLWSRISLPSREQEPELPWPVYCVLPHLRPKAPLHVRVLKAIKFWRKEEVKVSCHVYNRPRNIAHRSCISMSPSLWLTCNVRRRSWRLGIRRSQVLVGSVRRTILSAGGLPLRSQTLSSTLATIRR